MINKKFKKLIKSPVRFFKDVYLKRWRLKEATSENIFDQLEHFIDDYDVNSMKVGNEYIWPYLRNHIWAAINSVSIGQYNDYILTPQRIQGGHPSQLPKKTYNLLEKKYKAITPQNMTIKKSEILFFVMQNAVEQQRVGDKVYHKVIDPYYEAAKKLTSAQKIEVIRTKNVSYNWGNYVWPVRLLLLPQNLQDSKQQEPFKFDKQFFLKMRQHLTLLKTITPNKLVDIVDYELAARAYYLELLKKIQPKVICINYFHRYAPLISAADELGIITVDLQHGLQGGWGLLYNHYPEIKGISYQALPDYFAVWSENEAAHIQHTFESDNKHKPILMGNAWLHKQKSINRKLSKELQAIFDSDKKVVLVLLQKQMVIPKLLKKLIENSQDEVYWLVRHHPKGKKFSKADFTSFSEQNNVIISSQIDEAIPVQLCDVDLTLSEGSALSIEMRSLGVPGVIVGKRGKKGYKAAIKNGWLTYFDKPPNNISALLGILKSADKNNTAFFDDVAPSLFIKQLLDLKKKDSYEG